MVAAAPSNSYDELFVNNVLQEFEALVGQPVNRTGLVRFADAEIPPDPNPPVVRISLQAPEWVANIVDSDDYWLSIDGADSSQFSARFTRVSLTSNECTVMVTYHPVSEGTHTATLWLNCANAGVPVVKVPLRGVTTGVLGDLTGDSIINISDVTSMVGSLLNRAAFTPISDVNSDGEFSISDVTLLIHRVLMSE